MKTYLLIIFLAFSGLANAQTWCPLGAEWTYNYYNMMTSGYQKITYEKDTVVLSQPCKKLIGKSFVPYIVWWGVPPSRIDTLPINPIFTYIQNDTVFTFYNKLFRPVYYFNAKLGDTLSFYNSIPTCDSVIRQVVDSAGTVVINSQTLRYYVARNIQPDINSPWLYPQSVRVIERIGAIDNHFIPYFICYTDGDEYSLRCYSDNNFTTYQTDVATACNYIRTGIGDIDKTSFSISPNPAQDFLHLTGDENEAVQSVLIFNLGGQLVKRVEQAGFKTISTIDIKDIKSGIYFIQLISAKAHTKAAKFMKD